jgi:hypothetical protein
MSDAGSPVDRFDDPICLFGCVGVISLSLALAVVLEGVEEDTLSGRAKEAIRSIP